MRKSTAWVIITVVGGVAIILLGIVAVFRYSVSLVSPPSPAPNYTVQALIAVIFMFPILLAAGFAGLYAAQNERDRGRIVAWTAVILILAAALGSILALTLS